MSHQFLIISECVLSVRATLARILWMGSFRAILTYCTTLSVSLLAVTVVWAQRWCSKPKRLILQLKLTLLRVYFITSASLRKQRADSEMQQPAVRWIKFVFLPEALVPSHKTFGFAILTYVPDRFVVDKLVIIHVYSLTKMNQSRLFGGNNSVRIGSTTHFKSRNRVSNNLVLSDFLEYFQSTMLLCDKFQRTRDVILLNYFVKILSALHVRKAYSGLIQFTYSTNLNLGTTQTILLKCFSYKALRYLLLFSRALSEHIQMPRSKVGLCKTESRHKR